VEYKPIDEFMAIRCHAEGANRCYAQPTLWKSCQLRTRLEATVFLIVSLVAVPFGPFLGSRSVPDSLGYTLGIYKGPRAKLRFCRGRVDINILMNSGALRYRGIHKVRYGEPIMGSTPLRLPGY